MGQKVNPIGIRLGIVKGWNATWYADGRKFADNLNEDLQIRALLSKRLSDASVGRIQIERLANNARVTVHTSRPGVVIGKKGSDIERLRTEVSSIVGTPAIINIEEIRTPEMDSYLVAEGICRQLERRVMFRRAMKRAIGNAMRLGAKGIKIAVSGRLNGADIARTEWYREGRVPLHTLRADISYGFCEADTTYGKIGVKVWIFLGEIFRQSGTKKSIDEKPVEEENSHPRHRVRKVRDKKINKNVAGE